MDLQEARDRLRTLENTATAFFSTATEILGDTPVEDPYRMHREADFFWLKLPEEQRATSESLAADLVGLVPAVMPAVQGSPALTEADQRDLGFAVKELRAALRLRRYRHWDIEVLHDEGTVLGVQPPGQSDDHPLHPERAHAVFREGMERLTGILDLITQGPPVGTVPSAPAVPRGPAVRPGTAFIMMWMAPDHPELDDVSDTVKRCFDSFGIRALRSDDIQHEDLITRKILDEIRTAEFLFADLTGERPSVYYEVGYAHAIGRRVILFRKRGTAIHFDLAGYNCPEYENLRELEEQLCARLQYVTGEKPKAEIEEA